MGSYILTVKIDLIMLVIPILVSGIAGNISLEGFLCFVYSFTYSLVVCDQL